MKIGYIGLGKMGKNMVLRLLEQKVGVVAWNRSPEPLDEITQAGAENAESVADVVKKLRSTEETLLLSGLVNSELDVPTSAGKLPSDEGRRIIVWVMLPAGEVTENILVNELLPHLQPGDIVIDGANSHYPDTLRRAEMLKEKGIHFVDAGVSGGPDGARNGACVMIGGDKEIVDELEPVWQAISSPGAYAYMGRSGAGHFVKMVHNGIEYGMMQAIGEGFEVLKKSDFDLDVEKVAHIYNQKSVIESRLIGWMEKGFQTYGQELSEISGSVSHSGEGQWTVEAAKELGVKTPVIEDSLHFRIQSQESPSYTGQVVSTLRNMFGGHEVKKD